MFISLFHSIDILETSKSTTTKSPSSASISGHQRSRTRTSQQQTTTNHRKIDNDIYRIRKPSSSSSLNQQQLTNKFVAKNEPIFPFTTAIPIKTTATAVTTSTSTNIVDSSPSIDRTIDFKQNQNIKFNNNDDADDKQKQTSGKLMTSNIFFCLAMDNCSNN